MKKTKIVFVYFALASMLISFFPVQAFASGMNKTAEYVTEEATQPAWDDLKNYFSVNMLGPNEGDTLTVKLAPTPDPTDWERNEYSYTGTAGREISGASSSDPNTVAVNYTKDSITLVRGKGTNQNIKIFVSYYLVWAYKSWEKVLGVWYRVNDSFGPTGQWNDEFEVSLAQERLTVTPKQNNFVELNMFSSAKYDPINFVTYSGNQSNVIGTYKDRIDDSKLGTTNAEVIFSDGLSTVLVNIPIEIVDTTPPTGTLNDPIEIDVGSNPDRNNFFANSPYDNDFQNVIIKDNIHNLQKLNVGSYPYEVTLEDQSGNQTSLYSTLQVIDNQAPDLILKDLSIDYGMKVKPEDFIVEAKDNDPQTKLKFRFLNDPDVTKIGDQLVTVLATDNTGNETGVQANLTVNKDNQPPSAKGVLQVVKVGQSLPKDAFKVLTNVSDNSGVDKLSASYYKQPDTSIFGLTKGIVKLKDTSGNAVLINIPVFVIDPNDIYDAQHVLQANNFTVFSNEVKGLNASQLEKLILDKSKAKLWAVTDQSDLTSQVKVFSHDIQPQAGIYKALIKADGGTVEKEIAINVLDSNALIDVELPAKILFGSTDISAGNVISPKYTIKNNSKSDVSITLDRLDIASSSSVKLVSSNESDPQTPENSMRLYLNVDSSGYTNNVQLEQGLSNKILTNLKSGEANNLQLSGNYFGDYKNNEQADFDLVLKLEAK